MAEKTKEAPSKEVAKVNGQQNDMNATVKADNGEILSVADVAEQLKSMSMGSKIESQYYSFDEQEGVENKFVITNMTKIKKKNGVDGEMTDAVNLLNTEGKVYINADTQIVSWSKQRKLPLMVGIIFTGWDKSAKGKYRKFEFFELVKK